MARTVSNHQQRIMPKRQPSHPSERGFSLIEVMIAVVILNVGLLALIGTFAAALQSTRWSQEDLIAKQKALEALESVFTARTTSQVTFAQIANVSSGVQGALFTDGYTQMWAAGADGLVGTTDDVPFAATPNCPGGAEVIQLPGPDGILGNADDTCMSLGNFSRQVLITPLSGNLKQVTVNVQYFRPGLRAPRVYTVQALMSSYR